MTIEISGSVVADTKVRRYVDKVLDSLERYVPKAARNTARAIVVLNRVNRAHGNKYEAEITLTANGRTVTAKDSTLNVLAALDIVRLKLARAFENSV